MATFSANDKLGDVVARLPKAGDIFKKYAIDFCCGGSRPLTEAASEKNVNVDQLVGELNALYEEVKAANQLDTDWTTASFGQLVDHVVNEHHAYLHTTLPILGEIVTKILRVHGEHHPELANVHRLYNNLKAEFEQHMIKEETLVFPKIVEFEKTGSAAALDAAVAAIDELEAEHEGTGNILKELREVTKDYFVPGDACGTYAYTYQKLEEVESKTFIHVHLENNILFPRLRQAKDPQLV